MKPVKRLKVLQIEVWDCGFGHQHKTEEIAQRCIKFQTRKKKVTNHWTPENLRIALRLRNEGMTYRKIGDVFGVTAQSARMVVARASRHFHKSRDEAEECETLHSKTIEVLGLSVRSVNCLRAEGIKTVGRLLEHSEIQLFKLSNIGSKTLREIKEAIAEHGWSLRS